LFMKKTLMVLSVAALAGSVASAAEISGKIKLNGTPPPEKKITLDPMCGKLATGGLTTRHYVVGPDKGLANVFVYVKEGAKATPATGQGQLLDQVNCEYTPYVMGVQAGQTFMVKNSDNLLHNVHAIPKPGSGNKEKNIGQPVKGMTTPFVFEKPEVLVKFKCDVHPWMFAYVGVVEHPYFAVTDKEGNYKISGLPAGDYTVEAVHLKAGNATQKVKVGADEKKTQDFTLEAKATPGA
jgi:plastocyanin